MGQFTSSGQSGQARMYIWDYTTVSYQVVVGNLVLI